MKTLVTKFIPHGVREQELADFWYHKGYAEAELMAVVKKCKKSVVFRVTSKIKKRVKK